MVRAVPADRRGQAAPDRPGHGSAQVLALMRQARLGPQQPGHLDLAPALVEAAGEEEPEGRALDRYRVLDDRARHVHPVPGTDPAHPDTQVGVLGTGPVAELAEALAEAADPLEHVPADGHARRPHVAD